MTRRRELLKEIGKFAKEQGLSVRVVEGKNHTRIWVGQRYTTVPRHAEIPDQFAKRILRQIGKG